MTVIVMSLLIFPVPSSPRAPLQAAAAPPPSLNLEGKVREIVENESAGVFTRDNAHAAPTLVDHQKTAGGLVAGLTLA